MKVYKTSDTPLAAYLAMHYTIMPVEKDEFDKITFVFKIPHNDEARLEKRVSDFFSKEAIVDPLSYYAKIRYLKTIIYKTWERS